MAKLVLDDITSGYASTTALNTAFTAIETALENTLSRDGTSPNQMGANLDMNGYAILNQRATSGNENFLWLGTWATGTVYAVNNLIYAPEGSNEGATLICVTAHTAGATLDGDAAKWAVFAARGATGGGSGDVVCNTATTVDYLPQWSDTSGTVLKDGVPIGSGGVQAYSANTASYVANTLTAANKIPYATALNTASELDFKDEDDMASDSATALPSQQSVKAYVDTQVATVKPLTSDTAVTASGTTVNFTGIPSWAKKITVSFADLSTNGTSAIICQIGGSGGLEIGSYAGGGGDVNCAISSTTGFPVVVSTVVAANLHSGQLTLSLLNAATNTWVSSCVAGSTGSTYVWFGAGSKSLSSTLDRLTITTVGGANTFDSGRVNILYE